MTNSKKLPAMQFYPGDWRKDPGVQALDYYERGVWWEMCCLMFESDDRGKLMLNGLKMPDEALAKLLGLDNQKCKQIITTLVNYGVAKVEPDTGIIFSKRMVRDEDIRVKRQEAGKMGGNPALLNQTGKQNTTTGVKQKSTPSSSVSSSEHKPPLPPLPGLNAKAWNDYTAYRRAGKMRKLKPGSVEKLQRWLIAQGDEAVQTMIIEQSVRNGWTGLFELKNDGEKNGSRQQDNRSRARRVSDELDRIAREADEREMGSGPV
ncbi:MAG TPA: hypothetical protein ENJ35_04340 [Gammaproteobacteria bacterium]|nr:hypothetical protein [Gammaproteobacteria bacterium]